MKLQINFKDINVPQIVTNHFDQLTKIHPSKKQIQKELKYYEDEENIFKFKIIIFRKLKSRADSGWNYYAFPSNGQQNVIGLWKSKKDDADGFWEEFNINDLPQFAIFDLTYSIVLFEKFIVPKDKPKLTSGPVKKKYDFRHYYQDYNYDNYVGN